MIHRLNHLFRLPLLAALMTIVVPACAPSGSTAAAPPAADAPAQTAPASTPTPAPAQPSAPTATPPAAPTAPAAPADGKPAQPPAKDATAKPAQPQPPIFAVFECESGSFRVELATKQTPRLCANFINLANRGYYDGKTWTDFSRVVRQTGDNPGGDPAYTLPRELAKDLLFDKPGRLCYSNNSDDVSTARAKATRIFITVRPQDRWNLQYAVFGTIVEGLEVAFNLKEGEKIIRVRIEGDYAAHQARYAKQIAEWNAALDKVGLVDRR
jgi:peptidyl-prolyl cis-trans isomerase B (cyclophilin B)